MSIGTRAVLHPVDHAHPGVGEFECPGCGGPVKFTARSKAKKTVCNVYSNCKWSHVEQWHASCYEEAGRPYGEAR